MDRRICINAKPVLLALVFFLASCSLGNRHWDYDDYPTEFSSNGERIYFTGTTALGNLIQARTDGSMMSRHMRMHGGGCASCHGADREGQRMWPRFWLKAQALTPEVLFSEDHSAHGHDDHGGYDQSSLRRAITDGLRPNGQPLHETMPRWSISQEDLNDLVTYLSKPVGE